MLKLKTAAILALSLSLAPASAREFHSGHARGFNGHAGGFHNFNRHAAGGFHSGWWRIWQIWQIWRILGQQRCTDTTRSRSRYPRWSRYRRRTLLWTPAGYYLASDGACYPAY
jgi:Spy/CpxP family protein refolding chaperone